MAQPKFPTKISPAARVLTGHQQFTHSMIAQASRVPRLAKFQQHAQPDATAIAKAAASRARAGKR